MRPHRTPLEQSAIERLQTHLRSRNRDVHLDPSITDAPDAVLVIDAERVAVECRVLTPEKVLRLHGLTLEEGQLHSVFIPLEPHAWIQRALQDKNPKAQTYRQRACAPTAALLLHSSSMFDGGLFDANRNFYVAALVHGLLQTPCNFDVVLFSDEHSDEVLQISVGNSPFGFDPVAQQRIAILKIPMVQIHFGRFTATEGPDGKGQLTVGPLVVGGPREIRLQPLDKSFRVNYSAYFEAVREASSKGEKLPSAYALPAQGTSEA